MKMSRQEMRYFVKHVSYYGCIPNTIIHLAAPNLCCQRSRWATMTDQSLWTRYIFPVRIYFPSFISSHDNHDCRHLVPGLCIQRSLCLSHIRPDTLDSRKGEGEAAEEELEIGQKDPDHPSSEASSEGWETSSALPHPPLVAAVVVAAKDQYALAGEGEVPEKHPLEA